jgi:hypothetical protein
VHNPEAVERITRISPGLASNNPMVRKVCCEQRPTVDTSLTESANNNSFGFDRRAPILIRRARKIDGKVDPRTLCDPDLSVKENPVVTHVYNLALVPVILPINPVAHRQAQ